MLAALVVGVVIGLAIFGALEYYFTLHFWLAVVISVLSGVFAAANATLDFVKKLYEIRKLQFENRSLERKEEKAKRDETLVILGTFAEIDRIVNVRRKTADQVQPRPFVDREEDAKRR